MLASQPKFIAREPPSDSVLSSRLKKLIAAHPAARSKEEIAREEARKAQIAQRKEEERVRAARAAEEAEEANVIYPSFPGQSSGEESDGEGEPPIIEAFAAQPQQVDAENRPVFEALSALQAEKRRRKAERRAERKRARVEAARREEQRVQLERVRKRAEEEQRRVEEQKERARAEKRKEEERLLGEQGGCEKRPREQLEDTPRKAPRGDEGQKSPRGQDSGALGGSREKGKEPKEKKKEGEACLALGSPSKRHSAPTIHGTDQMISKPALPAQPSGSPLVQQGGTASAPPLSTGLVPKFGQYEGKPGSQVDEEASFEELAPLGGPPFRNGGHSNRQFGGGVPAQVLSQQGAPKRTSSGGRSLEVVRSADFDKARKKRQREEGGLGSSGLGGRSSQQQGNSKQARVQPVQEKVN
jgi:hypothetical protein